MSTEVEKLESTTIRISYATKRKLDILGAKNDSYEDIVNRLLEAYHSNKKHQ